MYTKFLINILLLLIATLVNAGDGCWDVKSRDDVQDAIDKQLSKDGLQQGHPTVVSLCKGTKVLFRKGDENISFPALGQNESFVFKCEESGTCVIDGGLLQKDARLFVGYGGFSVVNLNAGSLFIEGIVFQNFGVTEVGGVFVFSFQSTSSLYLYKCVFFENISKGRGGGAVAMVGNSLTAKMEAVHFKGNKCPNGFGGALAVGGNIDLKITKGIFNHNEAYYGGAISYYPPGIGFRLNLEFVEIQHNHAEEGGGLIFTRADCEWIEVTFNANKARKIGNAYHQIGQSNVHGFVNNYNKDTVESWANPKRAYIVF